MWRILKNWYSHYFNCSEIERLLIILLIGTLSLLIFNKMLAPLIVAIILAYLLEYPTSMLERAGMTRRWATAAMLIVFIGVLLLIALVILPIAWQQAMYLLKDIPDMLNDAYGFWSKFVKLHPVFTNTNIVNIIMDNAKKYALVAGNSIFKYSLISLIGILSLAVYLVIVPLMIFFLVKDKKKILNYLHYFLSKNNQVTRTVFHEMNLQITNYIRGKILEMAIVSSIFWITFIFFKLRYSLLLAVLMGISVYVPYVGASIVTIPVICIGLFQFGISNHFWSLTAVYFIIQGLHGNLLVPILFSEVVDMHPLVIIIAILFFGNLWGFWGVFFAIPLATFIKAVICACSKQIVDNI